MLFNLLIGFSQTSYDFEQIDSLQKVSPKPIAIFIHTDWCKYCLMMQESTFKNKKVLQEINDNFYFIRFNAESKKKIFYNGTLFKNSSGKEHELALALASKKTGLNYPTIIFLTPSNEIMHQQNEFTDASTLLKVIKILLTDYSSKP